MTTVEQWEKNSRVENLIFGREITGWRWCRLNDFSSEWEDRQEEYSGDKADTTHPESGWEYQMCYREQSQFRGETFGYWSPCRNFCNSYDLVAKMRKKLKEMKVQDRFAWEVSEATGTSYIDDYCDMQMTNYFFFTFIDATPEQQVDAAIKVLTSGVA